MPQLLRFAEMGTDGDPGGAELLGENMQMMMMMMMSFFLLAMDGQTP